MAERLKPPYDTPECIRTGEIIEAMKSQGWHANVSISNRRGWTAFVAQNGDNGTRSGYSGGLNPLDAIRQAIWQYVTQDKFINWWQPPSDEVLAVFERFGAAQPSDYIGRCEPQLSGTHV